MRPEDWIKGALIAGGVTAASVRQDLRTLRCEWEGGTDYPRCTAAGEFGNPLDTLDGISQVSSATT